MPPRKRAQVEDLNTSESDTESSGALSNSPVRRSPRFKPSDQSLNTSSSTKHNNNKGPSEKKRRRTRAGEEEPDQEVDKDNHSHVDKNDRQKRPRGSTPSTPISNSVSFSRRRRNESPSSTEHGKRTRLEDTHQPSTIAVPNGQVDIASRDTASFEDDVEGQQWMDWPNSFSDSSRPALSRKWWSNKLRPNNQLVDDSTKRPLSPSNIDNGASHHTNNAASNPNIASTDAATSIRVLTYNILSETLLKKSHYFPNISHANYERNSRHRRLMEELKTIQADVLCLQEVDAEYFSGMLGAALKESGFESRFTPNSNNGTHGLVLAYRESRFHLLAFQSYDTATAALNKYDIPMAVKHAVTAYMNEPEVFQVGVLQLHAGAKTNGSSSSGRGGKAVIDDSADRILCVGNIHVSWARHMKPDVRCVQVTQALWRITDAIETYSASSKRRLGWVLCGDFNSTPQSAAYQLATQGYPDDMTIETLNRCRNIDLPNHIGINHVNVVDGKTSLMDLFWPAFQHPRSDVASCYKTVLGREPPMTLNLLGNQGCVDYIWYGTEALRPREVLLPPSEYLRERLDRLPDENMPSDHTSMACSLVFL